MDVKSVERTVLNGVSSKIHTKHSNLIIIKVILRIHCPLVCEEK